MGVRLLRVLVIRAILLGVYLRRTHDFGISHVGIVRNWLEITGLHIIVIVILILMV